jgi:hypothetical protein
VNLRAAGSAAALTKCLGSCSHDDYRCRNSAQKGRSIHSALCSHHVLNIVSCYTPLPLHATHTTLLSSPHDEHLNAHHSLRPTLQLRTAGNAAAVAGELERAVELYTQGLALRPPAGSHLLLSNRSAALLQLGKRQEALADARQALAVSPASFHMVGYCCCIPPSKRRRMASCVGEHSMRMLCHAAAALTWQAVHTLCPCFLQNRMSTVQTYSKLSHTCGI